MPLDSLRQDLRHTLRLWANRPWNTASAVIALAIGIGANIGIFSVVNALLLRSLPFRNPARLAATKAFIPPHDTVKQFHNWAGGTTYLTDAAVFEQGDFNIGDAQNVQRARIAQTSSNFFQLLGTRPALGRTFLPNEDTPGRSSVAVISYGLWQQLFAGNAHALGATIRLNGMLLTIIGVAPPGFDYPSGTVVWKAADYSRGNNGWQTIARLKSGITWSQAQAAFKRDAERLWPYRRPADRIKYPRQLIRLQDELAGPVKTASLLLMAGVALILLIACANVSNLLLARTADRAPELSIRSALGATRARLTQQLLTECLLLSALATAFGLVIAFWTTEIASKAQPAPLAAQSYSLLDVRILLFAIGLSIVTGLLFGILPTLSIGRVHVFAARGSSTTRGARFLREVLVAAQVMLTIFLLVGSISVGRAFFHLMRIDRGFKTSGLVTVSVSLDGTTRGAAGHQLPFFEDALDRLRRLPGVHSASATEFLPLYSDGFLGGPFGVDGRPAKENSDFIPILSDYFQTMGGRILYGRDLSDADIRSDAKFAVVNDAFAQRFGNNLQDVLGHQVTIGDQPPRKIIGVARGMDYMSEYISGIGESHVAQVFVPAHTPGGFFSTFVVRVNGPAEQSLAIVRDTIRSVDPQVPVFGVQTMNQRLDSALARPRFYRTAAAFFAAFALLLAILGIYGVVSYAVVQRTHEMGVRLALGTTPVHLRTTLLRHGLFVVVAGALFGIWTAAIAARFLEALVEGAGSADPATLLVALALITLTAAASTWTATRRIAALDIMDILRAE